MSDEFNPLDYVVRTRGQRDYLEVKYRILWLRREHPTARVESECLDHTDAFALFRVTIDLDGKGFAQGHGSETRDGFANYIERAETRALGNALDALGFSTDAAFIAAGQKPPLDDRGDRLARREREAPPPSPPGPRPDYDSFWREVRGMGIVPQEALVHLGVRDLRGLNLEEAMAKLKVLKEQRDQERIGREREKEPPSVAATAASHAAAPAPVVEPAAEPQGAPPEDASAEVNEAAI